MSNNQPREFGAPTVTSASVIIGAIVAFGLMSTAAVLFVSGDASTERIGLLFAALAPMTLALVAALRADHAAKQTAPSGDIAQRLNGGLDERIQVAVAAALADRAAHHPTDRTSDVP